MATYGETAAEKKRRIEAWHAANVAKWMQRKQRGCTPQTKAAMPSSGGRTDG